MPETTLSVKIFVKISRQISKESTGTDCRTTQPSKSWEYYWWLWQRKKKLEGNIFFHENLLRIERSLWGIKPTPCCTSNNQVRSPKKPVIGWKWMPGRSVLRRRLKIMQSTKCQNAYENGFQESFKSVMNIFIAAEMTCSQSFGHLMNFLKLCALGRKSAPTRFF